MTCECANDRFPVSSGLAQAKLLIDEINRLHVQVADLQARVRKLDGLAHLDHLVGLPNRRCFLRDLDKAIARVNRYGRSAAVVFVDVDGLKQINDRFGHPTGDAVLIKVASILADSVRASDVVARLSGDEFAILLFEADELTAWKLALRIVETTLESRFSVGADSVTLSVSAGAGAIQAEDQPDDAILRADKAMYRFKSAEHTRLSPRGRDQSTVVPPRLVDRQNVLQLPA